jgi:glycerol-3-phosphate dehydrogenase
MAATERYARYDLVIVGGGITGAGILREAVRSGARVLLVEQGDFASGTSSASSKLVHGGLRYLKQGHWRLTLESVRERQRLLAEAAGLVEAQPFLLPIYRDVGPGPWLIRLGLALYDRMAGRGRGSGGQRSRWLDADALQALEPAVRTEALRGAMAYEDAQTDDARLVLRLIFDAIAAGAEALNYTRAELLRDAGRVTGLRLADAETGAQREIAAPVVINATGWRAAGLPGVAAGAPPLRPLRGSHFVFPGSKLPIRRAVSWVHPRDGRPIFAYPWQGAVLYGTTDLDHPDPSLPATMSAAEAAYLLEGLAFQFPRLTLTAADALSVFAGLRPVVSSGQADPSAESRESALWSSPGLVNVTGGKLTTFRVTARQALAEAARQHAPLAPLAEAPVFEASSDVSRLGGRLGSSAAAALAARFGAEAGASVGGTPFTWGELRWALQQEQVRHLDDLLLRRTRLGLLLAQGGEAILERVGALCREHLGWDEIRWQGERARYRALWQQRHRPPDKL